LNKSPNRTESSFLAVHIIRLPLFESLVGFGLVLGIWGSSWYIVLPLFILAFAALVLTFPTDKRLAKWQQGPKPSH
jgi:hypothetical protein